MIREGLAGKRIALSGVTGFLGSALLERLLTDTDVARIDAIARGDAPARIAGLLTGACFGPARDRLGGEALWELYQQKVRPLSADLMVAAPEIADDVDMVIHSAATVSFDPPVDEAFQTNLMGTTRLYEAAKGKPFIHVSTAYVAGMTRGTQAEELLDREIDWRGEAASALGARDRIEAESRRPENLERFAARARADIGRAGPQSIAHKAEELRHEWVTKRLVREGAARARSLGWPDVYAFTKAMTEKALNELAGDNPLTIVRPSIIESALERPFPGWIEGFRVAEPVILAYGRGALPDFPGIPEGVLDIIPVDQVVNCILAVASRPPERRAVYHISSGGRNPFRFRHLYELTREYFLEHPLPERGRGSFKVPVWSFPGRRAVEKRMRLAERVVETAERVVGRLPRNNAAREASRKVDRVRGRLDFVKRYAGLYGSYVEVEVIYTDDKARAMFESLPEEDRRDFNFDPASFTWEQYFQGIHLPAISAPMRWLAQTPTRPAPQVAITPSANGDEAEEPLVLAVFDVEGTIVESNVVEAYLWLRLAENGGTAGRAREVAAVAAKVPALLNAERRDRGEFLRQFYRQYAGADAEAVRALALKTLPDLFLRRLSAAAVRRIRRHRDAGHRIVFITGALDFIIEPIAGLADAVVTARLRDADGIFTGDMERPPLVGEARASWLRDYARANNGDLEASYAYADSMSDLPLLEAVGNPVAVNPDVALARIARKHRWPVEEWSAGKGAPKILMPEPGMTVALELYRSVPKYLAARAMGSKLPGMIAGPVAALRLVSREESDLPAGRWARLRPRLSGICGSDLTTIGGQSSFYFTALVSMPFVPGHEVVADLLDDVDGLSAGQRVVIDPLLSCAVRGVEPPCDPCAAGLHGLCERVTGGHVSAGLQTGYCADTGGGWSERMIAHRAQLHAVPDEMDDQDAVMIEPMACALHAVRRAKVPRDATVLVVGAGTVGLLTVIALKSETEAGQIIVVAKHGRQAELAKRFGATDVVQPSDALGAVRRSTRAFRLHPERSAPFLLGGADVSFECVGSKDSLDLALRSTCAQGRVVLSGMPARADLTPAWFRELELVGAYSGAGAFDAAIELAQSAGIGELVGASYPLSRWREAIDHAMSAGKLGTIKVAFDPTREN